MQISNRGLTRLGALLSNISGSITGAVDGLIHSTVGKVVSQPAVARLWVQRGFITGPSVTAVKTMHASQSAFGASRGSGERAGVSTGRAGAWVYVHRMPLTVGAVAVLIFIFWTNPTGL